MTADADTLARAVPFANQLSEKAREVLAGSVRVLRSDAGSVLLRPGDPVSGIYFVAEGAVRVHYLDAEGQEGTLYRLGPGESCVLALNCLFAEMDYPAWAEAEEDGVGLLILDGTAARELMQTDDGFLHAIFEQVSTRLYRLLGTLEQAIRLPLEARLVRLLLDCADPSGTVALPQERLAGHLGTSREVVSRIVRNLRESGLLETGYGSIRLVDRVALLERAG